MSTAIERLNLVNTSLEAWTRELEAGLLAPVAQVSPKFLYDALGSRLFDAITELDEYYPTRTEAAIFEHHRSDIARRVTQALGPRCPLVDLGAGDGAKAAAWFGPLGVQRYIAVDISVDHLCRALERLQWLHPKVAMTAVGMDFSSHLHLPPGVVDGPAVVFYPGSSIGNFAPAPALALLTQARVVSQGGGLLIGVDLVKDEDTLVAAYDDALGVTAAFNLNLLRHLNRLLAADFDLRQWRHVARFDAGHSRIEMHLEATQPLTVTWPGHRRVFQAGERIHTENSYKWTVEGFTALLTQAGFQHTEVWTDEAHRFAVCWAC